MEIDNSSMTAEEAEEEAKRLSAKVHFLKQCSVARSLLDECSTASICVGSGKLVEAATFLSKANSALLEAENGLLSVMSEMTAAASSYGANRLTMEAAAKREINLAKMVLDSIKMQCRRKSVQLYTRTSTIIDTCIQVTKSSISVKGEGGAGGESLADAYD
eukprot:55469-Ditylum_brightwellii.AAC.1